MCAIGIVPALRGAPLCGCDGAVIGTVQELLSDAATHRPAWLVVALADGRCTVAPARGARPTRAGMQVRQRSDAVRRCPVTVAAHAPIVPAPGLAPEHVVVVCRHYGLPVPRTAAPVAATGMPLAAAA